MYIYVVWFYNSFSSDLWTMACDGSRDSSMEIKYRSRICPHPEYKFDIDKSKKRGRARVLLHKILGWENVYYVCEEVRHHTIAHVKEYHDIYWFLNYLSEVWRCKEEIPNWSYKCTFESFCKMLDFEDVIVDRVRQYPTPVGAHMQLYLFTHWFHFIEIGKKIRAHGHNFEDVISAYLNWMNPMKDVTDLIGHLEALTVVKYSPRRYDILERNRR